MILALTITTARRAFPGTRRFSIEGVLILSVTKEDDFRDPGVSGRSTCREQSEGGFPHCLASWFGHLDSVGGDPKQLQGDRVSQGTSRLFTQVWFRVFLAWQGHGINMSFSSTGSSDSGSLAGILGQFFPECRKRFQEQYKNSPRSFLVSSWLKAFLFVILKVGGHP